MQPHFDQPVETVGHPLGEGKAAMILVHGRGAGPTNILDLAAALAHPDFTYLAPAAAGNTWYPHSFMAEIHSNEPGISSGLAVLADLVSRAVASGVPRERIVLAGFSQGACLTAEFAMRNAGRYGGVLIFSGGLIGPPGTGWPYDGDFAGTPVFFGCSDVDSHVPRARVEESAELYRCRGAEVTTRIYPGMGHLINEDEMTHARDIMARVPTPVPTDATTKPI